MRVAQTLPSFYNSLSRFLSSTEEKGEIVTSSLPIGGVGVTGDGTGGDKRGGVGPALTGSNRISNWINQSSS